MTTATYGLDIARSVMLTLPLDSVSHTSGQQFFPHARPAVAAACFGVDRLDVHQQRVVAEVAPLSTRLLHRTTRKLQLTPEGTAFYQRCLRILDDIDCAEHEAAQGAAPRGRVRINSHVALGVHYLMPLLPEFMARYPEVRLDVALSDSVVDLLDDRSDVAIRTGPLQDSRLVRRRLGASRLIVVAAPSYVEREGVPKKPQDLAERSLLGFAYARQVEDWPFKSKQGAMAITPAGKLRLGDGESMRQMAISGTGIARLARFHVDDDIQAGRLVPLLESYNPGDTEEAHAVFIGPGKQVPARVRVLLDFLADRVRINST